MTIRSLVGASEGYDESRFSLINANPSVLNGSFESIATVTVGSGGATNIDFTNIPQTYAHLQVRFVSRGLTGSTDTPPTLRVNFSSPPASSLHGIRGNGTSNLAEATAFSDTYFTRTPANTALANVFGAHVIDFYDYSSTTKRKTVRAIGGFDRNGAGWVGSYSGVQVLTSGITSIRLFPFSGNWAEHTTAALYGIKE